MLLLIPYPKINPVLVNIGPLPIRWYALAYIAGIISRLGLCAPSRRQGFALGQGSASEPGEHRRSRRLCRLRHHSRRPDRLCAVLQSAGLPRPSAGNLRRLEGRHVVPRRAARRHARHHPLRPPRQSVPVLAAMDPTAASVPIGLLLGRLANFIKPELWGRPTDVPWAMIFPGSDGAAAPSEPALRSGPRRRRPVPHPGAGDPPRRAQTARADDRHFRARLWRGADHLRILPRAGPAARLSLWRRDHGHAALGAADACRARAHPFRAAQQGGVNALAQEIAAMIAADGPISLERFMTLALQHPRHRLLIARDCRSARRATSSPRRRSTRCSAN